MAKGITYLFGAGASFDAIPVMKEIQEGLIQFMNFIKETPIPSTSILVDRTEEIKRRFLTDLEWLINENKHEQYASIDELARKLFLKKDTYYLEKLKNLYTIFLIGRQSIVGHVDKRYITFFNRIFQDDVNRFPPYIKILSWNYDCQFELAYQEYNALKDLFSSWELLKIRSKGINDILNYDVDSIDIQGFSIIKLNGSGIFLRNKKSSTKSIPILGNKNLDNISLADELINLYFYDLDQARSGELLNLLSFAWEVEKSSQFNIIDTAIQLIQDTKILVIIGYSFPYFNNHIDEVLISGMKNLYKVYIQSPEAENIKKKFKDIRGNIRDEMIILDNEAKDFVIPKISGI